MTQAPPILPRRIPVIRPVGWWTFLTFVGTALLTIAAGLLVVGLFSLFSSDLSEESPAGFAIFLGLVPLFAGLTLFKWAMRGATIWLCSNCQNRLSNEHARICGVCRAQLQ